MAKTMNASGTLEPVGISEIADRLGVAAGTVRQWRHRGAFDVEPRWTVSGADAWSWPDVAAWARERGLLGGG